MLTNSGLSVVLRQVCSRIISMSASAAAASHSTSDMATYSMSFVTAPSEKVAKELAAGLVSGKMAACVNIIPKVISVYEWENKVNEDSEVLMMIKSRSSQLERLTSYIREKHPYDVAEVISTDIKHGNQPYLDWIGEVVPKPATQN